MLPACLYHQARSSLLRSHQPLQEPSVGEALGKRGEGGGEGMLLEAQLALATHSLCTDAFLLIWMPLLLLHPMSQFLVQQPCPVLLEGPLLHFPLTSQALVTISPGVEVAI